MSVRIEDLAALAQKHLRSVCPERWGNLKGSISVPEILGEDAAFIKIGGDLAPYAVYTNEKWVAPRWHGKVNPNEHWIDKAVKEIAIDFSAMLGGELNFSEEEEKNRYDNTNYWDSLEGQAKIKEYGL